MLKLKEMVVLLTKSMLEVTGYNLYWVKDLINTVHANRDQRVTIKHVGKKWLLEHCYEITVSGKDGSEQGRLPDGSYREFTITFHVDSLHGLKKMQEMLTGISAIGIIDSGKENEPILLKVVDEMENKFIINHTVVRKCTTQYITTTMFDLGKIVFDEPSLVEFDKLAVCECIS